MPLILIFLTLIVFANSSFALFGVFDKDFCKNNPDDLLCSTGIADSAQKSTKKTSIPTVPSSTQNNKNIKINSTQTKTNVTEFKPLVKKQTKYDFDNLYNQMDANLNRAAIKKIKEKSKRHNEIRTICNSIKSFPFSWKKNFSKKYKINASSIKFLGATFTERGGDCSVLSSSDRGICKHRLEYIPSIVSRISNECK